jgi:transposase
MPTTKQSDGALVLAGPLGSEIRPTPSALSTAQAPPMPATLPATRAPAIARPQVGPSASGQRWSVARQRDVVLRPVRGDSGLLLSRELGIPIFKFTQWRQKADVVLDYSLEEREAETASAELAAATRLIGEFSTKDELPRISMERPGALVRRGLR